MDSGIFLMGKELENLENKLAKKFNRKYCIGTGSGTDALYLALRALDLKKEMKLLQHHYLGFPLQMLFY